MASYRADEAITSTPSINPGCRLLELPTELRAAIFIHILPTPINDDSTHIRWISGTTSLRRLSKSIHAEAAQLMYGQATFTISVMWDRTVFRTQSAELPHEPKEPFPGCFGKRYLPLIHRFYIKVEDTDDRIGMFGRQRQESTRAIKGSDRVCPADGVKA